MYMTGIVVAILGALVGLLVSAVDISGPFLVIILAGFISAYFGTKYIVSHLCTLTLPPWIWRGILSHTFLSRFDPVQATLNYVPRERRPNRSVSVCLRKETELLIDLIVRDFVMTWYEWISTDQFVPDEVAAILHSVVERAHGMFQHVDQNKVFEQVILLGRVHITCYQYALANVDRMEKAVDYHQEVAKLYCQQFHSVVPNQADMDCEPEFLRHVTDLLLGLVLPMSDARCEPARQLLGDVLGVNIMQRVVDLIVDPDWINEVIIIALSDTPAETLQLIESFDERPAEKESKLTRRESLKSANTTSATTATTAVVIKSTGQTTAGKSVTSETRSKQPVAMDRISALVTTESKDMSMNESHSSDSREASDKFDISSVVNKLASDVTIGIVGRQVMRRSTLETEYVAYNIQYKPALLWTGICSFDLVQEVPRRYKQFHALFSSMKENPRLSKALQGLELPAKRILPLLTQNQANDFVESRQELLDSFLKELCARPALRQCEEFKSFLREGSLRSSSGLLPRPLTRVFGAVADVMRSRTSSGAVVDLVRPYWRMEEIGDKGVTSIFNAFTRSTSMVQQSSLVGQDVEGSFCPWRLEWNLRCMDWHRRTELAEQGSWRGQKSAQCEDALRSAQTSRYAIPRKPSVVSAPAPRDKDFAVLDHRWPLTSAFFELGSSAVREASALKNGIFQKLVICALGGIVDRFVCSELDELLRERRLAYVVRLLRDLLWPDGHWPEEAVEVKRTHEERQANKDEALQKLIEFLPASKLDLSDFPALKIALSPVIWKDRVLKLLWRGFLRIIVGPRTYDRGFKHVVESLQNPGINRCLVHAIISCLVNNLATFPEDSATPPATPIGVKTEKD